MRFPTAKKVKINEAPNHNQHNALALSFNQKIVSGLGLLLRNNASNNAVLPILFFPLIKLILSKPDIFNSSKYLKF